MKELFGASLKGRLPLALPFIQTQVLKCPGLIAGEGAGSGVRWGNSHCGFSVSWGRGLFFSFIMNMDDFSHLKITR